MKKVFALLLALSLIFSTFLAIKFLRNKSLKNNLLILDVNDPELYNIIHIKGALNLSYDNINNFAKNIDKDIKIITYCSGYMCIESDRVADKLRSLNFKNVKVYKGGIHQWYQLYLNDKEKFPLDGSFLKNHKLPNYLLKSIDDTNISNNHLISSDDLSKLINNK